MKKKILSLMVALSAITALGAADFEVDGIAYNLLGGDSVEVTSKSPNYSGNITIPATVTYESQIYRVTSIVDWAFYYCTYLTSITIPNSVTSIGDRAFFKCTSLTSITIPNSVTSIGDEAFYYCRSLISITVDASNTRYSSLDGVLFNHAKDTLIQYPIGNKRTSYTIPNSVTSIGDQAFFFCTSLTSITIPNSVTSIGEKAFYYCRSLTTITIPNSVTSIGDYAFSSCTSLASITIPNSVTSIGNCAFSSCTSLASITIPKSVTSIGDYAFSSCTSLTSVTIPNSVTSIGYRAFSYCHSLTSITIPNSVTSIGEKAFDSCTSLTSVTIPNSVTSIGEKAFDSCTSLTSVTIPNSVTSIGYGVFASCTSLVSISVDADNIHYCSEDGVLFTYAKDTLIQYPIGNSRTTYTIPNSVTCIGSSAFANCSSLTKVAIGKFVKIIKVLAFDGCNKLTSVCITDLAAWCRITFEVYITWEGKKIGKTIISSNPLYYAKHLFLDDQEVTDLVIPQGVDTINMCSFCECVGITSVFLPKSIVNIGFMAFSGSTEVKSITCEADVPPTCDSTSFTNISKSISIYVPSWSISTYQTAKGWKDFTNIRRDSRFICGDQLDWQYNQGTLYILGKDEMYDYTKDSVPWLIFRDSITDIKVDNGVTSMGAYAFYGCSNKEFKTLLLPNSILTIGDSAFADCAWLKTITMGTDLEEIGDYAFSNDSRLIYINCYATEPPLLGATPFANYNAYLKVPCNVKDEYVVSLGWSSFTNISCISAETVEVTEIQSDPTSTSVEIAWPAVSGSDNYTIEVKQGSKVICTIIFNAQGQLLSINFPTAAPARGIANAQEAVETATGWAYTINGLTPGTAYTYSVVAKDANGKTIDTKNGSFSTTSPTAIENINDIDSQNSKVESQKFLRDGILLINRNGVYYNAQGAIVE